MSCDDDSNEVNSFSDSLNAANWALSTVLPVICIFGIALNLASILVFNGVCRGAAHRKNSMQVYLTALCIFDIIQLALSSILFPIQFWDSRLQVERPESQLYKNLHKLLIYCIPVLTPMLLSANCASIWTMVGITIQRFIAIVFPFKVGDSVETIAQAYKGICLIVLISIIFCAPNYLKNYWIIPENSTDLSIAQPEFTSTHSFVVLNQVFYLLGMFLIPFLVLTILNGIMLHTICMAQRQGIRSIALALRNTANSKLSNCSSSSNKRELRPVFMIAAVVILFFLCHTLALYNLSASISNPIKYWMSPCSAPVAYLINDVNNLLININSMLNPFVYLLFTKRFSDIFWERVRRSSKHRLLYQNSSANNTTCNKFSLTLPAAYHQVPAIFSSSASPIPAMMTSSAKMTSPAAARMTSVSCYSSRTPSVSFANSSRNQNDDSSLSV